MRFFAQRISNVLVPEGQDSIDEFERLPTERLLRIDAVQSRNIKFHRLYFALCAKIGKGIGQSTEWVSNAFKTETGHYHIFEYAGKVIWEFDSIAFDKMDNLAFRDFFENCVQIAYREWKIDPKDIADLLIPEGYKELVSK